MLQRYRDIDSIYKLSDYHLHSGYSDGKSSMSEMVSKCVQKGYNAIAFSDHMRETSDYYPEYFKEIDELSLKSNIKILKGAEVRISDFDGTLNYPCNIKNDLDILIASVHRISIGEGLYKIEDFNEGVAFELETLLSLKAIEKNECNVLGHCGGMCLTTFNKFPLKYFEKIIGACAQNDVAFEINSRYHKNVISELAPILEKYNPYVTFGSDAHHIDEIRGIYE